MFEKGAIIRAEASTERRVVDQDPQRFNPISIGSLYLPRENIIFFEGLMKDYLASTNLETKSNVAIDFGRTLGIEIARKIEKHKGQMHVAGCFFLDIMGILLIKGYDIDELVNSKEFKIGLKEHMSDAGIENVCIGGINGAKSVYRYVSSLENVKDIVFIGSYNFLDIAYAVDLIVGIDNSSEQNDQLKIDELKLIQVKTQTPFKPDRDKIQNKHRDYANLLRELVLSRPARELAKQLRRLNRVVLASENSISKSKQTLDKAMSIYNLVLEDDFTSELSFNEFHVLCQKHNRNTLDMYSYVTQVDQSVFNLLFPDNESVVHKLCQVRENLDNMFIPQEFIGNENRKEKDAPHLASALKIKSVIAVGDITIQEIEI
jgi:hypothetical protein